jgi:hypothetical protein
VFDSASTTGFLGKPEIKIPYRKLSEVQFRVRMDLEKPCGIGGRFVAFGNHLSDLRLITPRLSQ